MKRISFIPLLLYIALAGVLCSPANDIRPLTLIRALPVDGPDQYEPSGLTMFNDTLFTVSDRHDDTIFRIEVMDDRAVLVPHLTFTPPVLPGYDAKLDFEGITCDADGHFYLVSEAALAILRVSADGQTVEWITSDMRETGERAGLFQVSNAYLEGIAWIDRHTMLVCAERQPRGLIEVDMRTTPFTFSVFNYDKNAMPGPGVQSNDFTGLYAESGAVYILQRNIKAIGRITYGRTDLEKHEFWSYAHIVDSDAYRYTDMQFGKAEGLCMDRERIYVILDNNNLPRASNQDDLRPLLLIMRRP